VRGFEGVGGAGAVVAVEREFDVDVGAYGGRRATADGSHTERSNWMVSIVHDVGLEELTGRVAGASSSLGPLAEDPNDLLAVGRLLAKVSRWHAVERAAWRVARRELEELSHVEGELVAAEHAGFGDDGQVRREHWRANGLCVYAFFVTGADVDESRAAYLHLAGEARWDRLRATARMPVCSQRRPTRNAPLAIALAVLGL
jgi:hypothetical protein